ncbi:MAG: UDP-N-acetylmuramoyl-tripeptide--D-alanyl-D-alanine ligase [Planctomycetaceae bacterium]|nr:UDP-N-acetylmuramoyl-tripeptide--D-alanyl-D-alanine ligase [Planctomycetaceae bacterium]MDP7277707.1 UDP-N-acetylmuramoyl-tripeptide--D-alanyl-D-alanine ligase [Planctomycetaceae bacterium]
MKPIGLSEIAAVIEGEVEPAGHLDPMITGVVTDSRAVEKGELFVGLPGARCDGADFVDDAARRGAGGVVASRGLKTRCLVPRIVVRNPLSALWELASWNREQCPAVRVAVSGSAGKTTARQMIHCVLETLGTGKQSPENFNNHVGLPLSLLRLDPEDRFAVLEVGVSGPGEMAPLGALAAPRVVVLTGTGRAHLGGFGSVEMLVREKARLLEAVSDGGLMVVPDACSGLLESVSGRAVDVVRVGEGTSADISACDVSHEGDVLEFRIEQQEFRLNVAGRHFLTAALSAVAVARWLGIADKDSAKALTGFRTARGRCRVEWGHAWTVIDDTYNASPESVLAACELLGNWRTSGRRILILGDMAELGDEAEACHAEIGGYAARCGIEQLWAVGVWADRIASAAVECGMARDQVHASRSIGALKDGLGQRLEAGDTVLIKGARRERMERVVAWLKETEDSA